MHTTSVPPSVPGLQQPPHFSPARQYDGLIFVSGQMAFDGQWRIAGDTVAEQTQRCLERIAAILGEQGAELADVVKTTVWLTRCEDFAEFNRSYAQAFAQVAEPPARSTVRADLMVPHALVEIEAIARVRDRTVHSLLSPIALPGAPT